MKKNGFFSLLILLSVILIPVKVSAQSQTLSLNFKDLPLQDVFQLIEKHSNYRFIFNNNDVSVYQASGNFQKCPLQEILEDILKDKPFQYSLNSNTVIISYVTSQTTPIIQKGILIKGTVKDREGHLLPGVTIRIQNSSLGVTTDQDGQFSITIPDSETFLVFSFVGMKTQVSKADFRQPLNIILENDTQEIDEVVVTGIFKKSRESYTGAVTVITEKELKAFGNRNILTTIRNIDPAFNIMPDNMNGSNPNKLPEIQIRGNSGLPDIKDVKTENRAKRNTPLFIQDGFEITLQKMMDLNEHDIASITILKDASATSLYGSRGANGVVVITMKKPEAGKLRISYQGDFNIEIPDLSDYRLLNAKDKLEAEKSANLYITDRGSVAQQILDEIYYEKKAEIERGVNTYWLSKPLHTGYGQRHSIRLEGGDPTFRYSASVSYNDIVGVMKKSGRKNFMGNMTLTYNYKNIIFRNDLNISLNKAINSPYGNFSDYVKLNPYDSPYDEEGVLKYYLEHYETYVYKNIVPNPLYNATLNTFNTSEYTNLNNNFAIEWRIIPELRFMGGFGITKQLDNSDIYKPAKHTDFSEYSDEDYLRKGSYEYGSGKSLEYECNLVLDFSQTFADKHQVFAGINFNTSQRKSHQYNFKVEGFTNENLDFPGLAMQYAKDEKPYGTESLVRKLGYTANFNYTYDQRYFIDGAFRLDGSSQFGNNKRFAPFWSIGTGWNIHQEHFFKCNFFDQLRLRVSYGITGSQNFDAYQAQRTYQYYTNDRYQQWTGAQLMAMGNEDLKWQQTKELNFGLDTRFWNNRVNISLNYYRNLTSNLLSEYELPLSNGFSSYTANIGKVENTGFELTANIHIVRNTEKNIFWSVGGSLLRNNNKIKKISDALKQANEELEAEGGANPNYIYREGKATNTLYVVRSLGIDPSTGQEIYLTRDGEKTFTWDARDKVALGVPEKYRGNLYTTIRYKNLSANLVFGYRFGGQIYNSTLIEKVENTDLKGNADRRVFTQRWVKAGDVVPYTKIGKLYPTNMTSRFVKDERTFECQNINLSYDCYSSWLKKQLRLQAMTISCNIGDVFRISTVKQERGIAYPFSRKVSISLFATF